MQRFYFILLVIFCFSCQNMQPKKENKSIGEGSIFSDQTLQKIYELQYDRDTEGLTEFFSHEKALYRKAAVQAMASVQDTLAIGDLVLLLNDNSEDVKAAAAYALGQIGNSQSEVHLIRAFKNEQILKVKRHIMEAIGKCGTKTGLNFLSKMSYKENQLQYLSGQAWGLSRFSIRGYGSNEATKMIFQLMNRKNPEKIRTIASNYLVRTKSNINNYHKELIYAYSREENIVIRQNLARAMGKVKHKDIAGFLQKILNTNVDYRIKLNVITSLEKFKYNDNKEIIFKLLNDTNKHLAIMASVFIKNKAIEKDIELYLNAAKKTKNWQIRCNLLSASLNKSYKKEDLNLYITKLYKNTTNKYEKAYLLKALSNDLNNAKLISSEVLKKETPAIVKTIGMEALIDLRKDTNFDKEQEKEFAEYFKKAIESGDAALAGMSASILREPKMNFASMYPNTYFLTQALRRCNLPSDIETYIELQKTIDFINGTDTSKDLPNIKYKKINWDFIAKIPPNQKIRITTSKGDIVIQLLVNDAPETVASFLELIESDYYKKSIFHRVVPNFVVQTGCSRGDGWGSPNFAIRSEFPPVNYQTGSVGMASSGKDTEGSQWFITHSPTPHLDGKYTMFAKVIDGIDKLHKIQIGDEIFGFEILKDDNTNQLAEDY